MTTKNKSNQHLENPRQSQYNEHHLFIERTQQSQGGNRYKMSCRECGCYVKWATEAEYQWWSNHKPTATFRQLFWAPRYDKNFEKIRTQLFIEKIQDYEQV